MPLLTYINTGNTSLPEKEKQRIVQNLKTKKLNRHGAILNK